MSSSPRSTHSSTRQSWAAIKLQRVTRTPSVSQHQVPLPTRVLTTPSQSQHHQSPPSRVIYPPRQNFFTSMDPQDDASNHLTESIVPNMMAIQPCSDFTKYGA